ncbi:hypothetical protein [Clostridium phage vB_CpeS-17DYC]|nr:hypothetical protein [Clostridium phage vB_CpeS-17DYC]
MDLTNAIKQQCDINERKGHKETLLKGKKELLKEKDVKRW